MLRAAQKLAKAGTSYRMVAVRSMTSIPRIGWDKPIQELDPEIFGLIQVRTHPSETCHGRNESAGGGW